MVRLHQASIMHLVLYVLICPLEGTGPLQWQGGSASKPGKPKGKKKCSSRQKFDVSSLKSIVFSCIIFKGCSDI